MLRKEFCEANIFSPRNGGCFPGDIRVTKICPPLPLKKKKTWNIPFPGYIKKKLTQLKAAHFEATKKSCWRMSLWLLSFVVFFWGGNRLPSWWLPKLSLVWWQLLYHSSHSSWWPKISLRLQLINSSYFQVTIVVPPWWLAWSSSCCTAKSRSNPRVFCFNT